LTRTILYSIFVHHIRTFFVWWSIWFALLADGTWFCNETLLWCPTQRSAVQSCQSQIPSCWLPRHKHSRGGNSAAWTSRSESDKQSQVLRGMPAFL